jgi:hypothetical protein
MPKTSNEYQYYKLLCDIEAFVYTQLGGTEDSSEEDFNAMIAHYKKARAIYNLVDMKDDVSRMDNRQATNDGTSSYTVNFSDLEVMRNMYERDILTHGMDSQVTMRSGLLYAKGLRVDNHCIEAEKLVTKLFTISRRVHGPEHNVTVEAIELLEKFNERYVQMYPDDGLFQALQYENVGEICVVTGPITDPRVIENERTHHIENNLLIPNLGCPVICHGLVSASLLNGELGEVRHFKQDQTGMRYAVYFEKKGVKSALVKPENLRIAFELPTKV